MKKIIVIVCFGFAFVACKKDKLEGDTSIFIGTWNWVYSSHTGNYCDGSPVFTEIITPASINNDYSIEFLEKEIIKYYEKGYEGYTSYYLKE